MIGEIVLLPQADTDIQRAYETYREGRGEFF